MGENCILFSPLSLIARLRFTTQYFTYLKSNPFKQEVFSSDLDRALVFEKKFSWVCNSIDCCYVLLPNIVTIPAVMGLNGGQGRKTGCLPVQTRRKA